MEQDKVKTLNKLINKIVASRSYVPWATKKELPNLDEAKQLAKELGMTDKELEGNIYKRVLRHDKQRSLYRLKPQKEGRDNKDVLVGSGGSNGSSIRYPSKKRSLSTWKKFYKLFPYLAEQDKFDGKTSKRMK